MKKIEQQIMRKLDKYIKESASKEELKMFNHEIEKLQKEN